MTLKAGRMCRSARRDREGDAPVSRFMANRAVDPLVTTMIEPRGETAKPRKSLHSGRSVADSTDRALIIGELQGMAAGTWQMARTARETYSRRVVVPPVTEQAGQTRVNGITVQELRVILVLKRRSRFRWGRQV